MKKLLTIAVLSLGAICMNAGKASAWLGDHYYSHWFCREVCTWPYVPVTGCKSCCNPCCPPCPAPYFMKPYNAFSLPCFGSFGGCGPCCGGGCQPMGCQPIVIPIVCPSMGCQQG